MNNYAVNPYLPSWEYVPDGEPYVFDDRLYVYGSHDTRDGNTYCLEDYVGWSAPIDDLSDWRFEGVIFHKTDDPRNKDGSKLMFAPDMAKGRDGRYYLYYFLSDMKAIGVAVCDKPSGPFDYYGNVQYPDGKLLDGTIPFDPGILSDDSGNWLYYGFCLVKPNPKAPESHEKGCYCVELEDDMITVKSKPVEVLPGAAMAKGSGFENHGFFEAASIRHIDDTYYLVYSSEQGHELCYATSKYPDRDFSYRGVIVSNGDIGYKGRKDAVNYVANNHGGMVHLKDKWYIFYHRHTHKRQYSRQGCAEPIEILNDGTIYQVEVTSCGLNGEPLPARAVYSSHIICGLIGPEGTLHLSSSVHRRDSDPYLFEDKSEDKEQGNMFVKNLRGGAECTVKYIQFDGSENVVQMKCRGTFKGCVNVLAQNQDEKVKIASVEVNCEQSYAWKTFCSEIKHIKGKHAISFQFIGTGTCDFDSFGFSLADD